MDGFYDPPGSFASLAEGAPRGLPLPYWGLLDDSVPDAPVRQHPEVQDVVTEEVREKVRKEERKKMRLLQARADLRRVLARRGLVPSADDEARMDTCTTLATLEPWCVVHWDVPVRLRKR